MNSTGRAPEVLDITLDKASAMPSASGSNRCCQLETVLSSQSRFEHALCVGRFEAGKSISASNQVLAIFKDSLSFC